MPPPQQQRRHRGLQRVAASAGAGRVVPTAVAAATYAVAEGRLGLAVRPAAVGCGRLLAAVARWRAGPWRAWRGCPCCVVRFACNALWVTAGASREPSNSDGVLAKALKHRELRACERRHPFHQYPGSALGNCGFLGCLAC